MVRLRSGHYDLDSFSPETYLPAAKTPLFIIAGERDGIMPPEDVRRLYDAARGPKELWVVAGAAHAKCRQAAPADYEARVSAFLRARFS
jgi:hypothetical protein